MDDIINWMTLSQLPGVGLASFWSIVNHFGTPGAALQNPEKNLQMIKGIGKKQLQGFARRDEIRQSCRQQLLRLHELGGVCISFNDAYYPENLKEISDPPPILYILGDKSLLNSTSMAIVGSRASTTYGSRVAFGLAKNLARAGVTVASGMALGIDTEAHRGALVGSGKTIGVLGCGIDVIYPPQNRQLFQRVAETGAIISEYPLGTSPEGFRFPARNRIIAGLSKGVVVVEAARKSGSLITAQLALDEGREVYAVPGQVDSYKSEGTHWLLKQGAKLVQSENDVLEDLVIHFTSNKDGQRGENTSVCHSLQPEAKKLLDCIEVYPITRDRLIQKSGLPISEFSELLLLLELEGLVELLPGDEVCVIR